MRNWRLLAGALIPLLACCATPPAATGGSPGIRLWSNVTKADTVGIKVSLGGFPNERCVARIGKGRRVATVRRPVRTSESGGARWSWLVPGNVGGGLWKFTVTCAGGRRVHRASTSFHADAGIGSRSSGLWIRKSMAAGPLKQSPAPEGNGGGSGNPYPVGQSTWWVALHRPDLPFFPHSSGDALNWAKSAAARGFAVGTTPEVGAVAVFQPHQYGAGRYGHVALVTAIDGRKITVSEANFRGRARRDRRSLRFRGIEYIYRKENPAPILEAPTENSTVSGLISVSAKAGSAAVRFAVYSYANPADHTSGHWETLTDDATPGDGFSAVWDTTGTPIQGGPGTASAIVSAIAINRKGEPVGAHSDARVNVANSRSADGKTFYPYYVVGTCEEGECGLELRSAPRYVGSTLTGTRHDGEEVDIVCQAHGETFISELGGVSDIWDMLTNGSWVSDFFVDTPERGAPSPPIPLCP
jgi:surface antigen